VIVVTFNGSQGGITIRGDVLRRWTKLGLWEFLETAKNPNPSINACDRIGSPTGLFQNAPNIESHLQRHFIDLLITFDHFVEA